MTKVQMMAYGLMLVTKLLGRLRQLNDVDTEEEIAQVQGELNRDIQQFSEALSMNRQTLDAWLIARGQQT